ncbi:MAG: hypothetical protein PVH22_01575 [Desulfobacteraceae bacterium]|jgi:hypothetical protein
MGETATEGVGTDYGFSPDGSSGVLDLEGTMDRMRQESYKTAQFLQVSAECNTIVTGASVVSSCLTNNNKEISKVATKTYTSG